MDKMMTNNGPSSKRIWLLLALVAVIIVITIVTLLTRSNNQANNQPAKTTAPTDTNTVSTAPGAATIGTQVEIAKENVAALKDARQEVSGSVNLITASNQVVNLQGEPVKTNVPLTSPEAPQQTGPLAKDQLSAKVIKIDIGLSKGISPAQFTVAKGAPISIAVSSADEWTHIFRFRDPSLSSVVIGVASGETRGMTFNAPTKAGDYEYYCDLPGHASRGEVGKMIVK